MEKETKIYRLVVIDMKTGDTLFEDSYLYRGPLALMEGEEPPAEPPAEPPEPPAVPPAEPPAEPPEPPAPPPLKYKSHEEAEAAYKELETKLGDQGRKLGDLERTIQEFRTKEPAAPATPPPVDTAPVKPNVADFDQFGDEAWDKYQDALRAYDREVIKFELRKDREKEEAERTQLQTVQRVEQSHTTRMADAIKEDPELETIQKDPALIATLSPPMRAAIMLIDEGPQLVRYLHEHKDEATRIFQIAPVIGQNGRQLQQGNPFLAFLEMGRLAERLKSQKPAPKPRSQTPPPHEPVGGRSGGTGGGDIADLAKSNPDEYLKRVHEGKI